VAGLNRNGWQLYAGTGGRFSPELLAGLSRNTHKAKRLKNYNTNNVVLLIEKDFNFIVRNEWNSKNWSIPNCKILQDNNSNWW